MSLFNKKQPEPLPDLITDEELAGESISKESVLDYMVALDDDEFDKLIKVAKVYRDADKKANGIWGVSKSEGEQIDVRVEHSTDDGLDFEDLPEPNAKKGTAKNDPKS